MKIEQGVELPHGNKEYFSGYGVLGLTFSSGQILALRCFPSTSLGKGYRSVWHRNPEGNWVFYQNVPSNQACPRYFGSALLMSQQVSDIEIDWTGSNDFTVSIKENPQLQWQVSLVSTPATSFMNSIARIIPEALWYNNGFLNFMGVIASYILGAGHLGLTGKAPNGQKFIATPRQIWRVANSTAQIQGESLGTIGALKQQASLGEFWIPLRGIFAIGISQFETFNPAIHSGKVSSS